MRIRRKIGGSSRKDIIPDSSFKPVIESSSIIKPLRTDWFAVGEEGMGRRPGHGSLRHGH